MAAVNFPSTTIQAADVGTVPYDTSFSYNPNLNPTDWYQKPKSFILDSLTNANLNLSSDPHTAGPFARHLATTNVLFMDGHVKALSPFEIWAPAQWSSS